MKTRTDFDVIVAGAGPAGATAAIAAGRAGARVLLLEKLTFCGGVWTAGAVTLVYDLENKGGLMEEYRLRLVEQGHWQRWLPQWTPSVFHSEYMKVLLDELLQKAGVTVRLGSIVVGAQRDAGRIASVQVASKSGLEMFAAKVFIDATGDGDLAARAGCKFDMGRPEDGKCQPGTTFGLVGGWPEPLPDRKEVLEVILKTGYDLSYHGVAMFPQVGCPGVSWFMATHLYGLDPTDAASLSRAEIDGRRLVVESLEALRGSGDPRFANLHLLSLATTVGIREGRRIRGRYVLSHQDVLEGRQFDDGVCTAKFNIDIHHVVPGEGRHLVTERIKPYQIPYRSLIAADVDNLLLAGRCISGDFYAHATYRVTGNAVATGEAVGRAAAIAVRDNIALAEVDAAPLRIDPPSQRA